MNEFDPMDYVCREYIMGIVYVETLILIVGLGDSGCLIRESLHETLCFLRVVDNRLGLT